MRKGFFPSHRPGISLALSSFLLVGPEFVRVIRRTIDAPAK
jgi:hypothetical protein